MRLIYFASLRERLGLEQEQLDKPAQVATVAQLVACLAARGGQWQSLQAGNVLVAVNQEMVGAEQTLQDDDEVAFFPPVTGG